MNKEDLNIDRVVPKYATASLFLFNEGKLCLVYPMIKSAYMIEENQNDFVITVSKTKKVIYEKIKVESLEREHEISEVDFIKTDVDMNNIIIDEPKNISSFLDKNKEQIIDLLGKEYNVLLDNLVSSNYFTLDEIVSSIEEIVRVVEERENKLDDEELVVYEMYINKIKTIETKILSDYMKENIVNFEAIRQFYMYLLITEPYNIKLFESSLNQIKEVIAETTN